MPIPDSDLKVRVLLEQLAGHHARTVRRDARLPEDALLKTLTMCPVCAAPIAVPYERCAQCLGHRRGPYRDELADMVIPLTYAVKGYPDLSQFYSDLFSYKREPHPSDKALNRVAAPVLAFARYHLTCLEKVTGHPVTGVTTVPSGRGRSGERLRRIATSLGPVVGSNNTAPSRDGRASGLQPDNIEFESPVRGHLIVLEDTWVTGANAQSVAVQAHRAGASSVSIVVIARLLDYGWSPSQQLIDSWSPDATWQATVCPVSGAGCP